jgi:hypothetical protein
MVSPASKALELQTLSLQVISLQVQRTEFKEGHTSLERPKGKLRQVGFRKEPWLCFQEVKWGNGNWALHHQRSLNLSSIAHGYPIPGKSPSLSFLMHKME